MTDDSISRLAKLPPKGSRMRRAIEGLVAQITREHLLSAAGGPSSLFLAIYCAGVSHGAIIAQRAPSDPDSLPSDAGLTKG